jgi:hypothetical protein
MNSRTLADKINFKIKEIVIDFENLTFSITMGLDVKVTGTFRASLISSDATTCIFVDVFIPRAGNPTKLIQTTQTIIKNRVQEKIANFIKTKIPKMSIA